MKRFVNARETIVTDAIDGMLAIGDGLARLDGYPHVKVVVRDDWDRQKVAVVSGGGAGHEPAHAGFVGRGMLAGAVSGDVFASPGVDAVLACIMAVTGDAGCLLIVKNYTGDRLNFGLAAERAKRLGFRVEMVVVADDIALPDPTRARGIAGTLLVHKIAGHLAERGCPLAVVRQGAADAAAAIRSLGVSYSSGTVPGQPPAARLGERDAELGMGIHGEPGASVIEVGPARRIVDAMVERLCAGEPEAGAGERRFGLLVNNLGVVPPIEMSIIVDAVMASRLGPHVELLFGPAPLMTSLDMNGFSLSLIALDDDRREALLAPVAPRAWPPGSRVAPIRVRPLPQFATALRFHGSSDERAASIVRGACRALIEGQSALNRLDAKVGDGDTGSTFATGARSILAKLEAGDLPLAEPDCLCLALGELLGRTTGGSSGVLLSILFTTAGSALGRSRDWPAALERGIHAVAQYGGANAGDRTMLDALIPAVAALRDHGLAAAAAAARRGADATASMLQARAGRSAYVNAANLGGVQDPGAVAVAIAFEAAARATEGERAAQSA